MFSTWSVTLTTLLLAASVSGQGNHRLTATVSNNMPNIYVDGERMNTSNHDTWNIADVIEIDDHARLIAVQALNFLEGCSGIMVAAQASVYDYTMVSDRIWKCSLAAPTGWMNIGFDDSDWEVAFEVGQNGVVPGCSWIPLPAFPNQANWIWSPRYMGLDPVMQCRGYTPVCSFGPCQNGGSCHMNQGELCTCPPHFTGRFCETEINECESNPCVNGGDCELDDQGYHCNCPIGFSGVHCETDISPCASSPCQNGATCNFDLEDGGYTCSCVDGYSGQDCETLIDYCESIPCQNGGTCEAIPGAVICTCMPGFTGALCQIQIDYCVSNPCINAGTCMPGINMYSCLCQTGWTGVHCETGVGFCASSPCLNGGTCTLNGFDNSVQCICPEGWYGILCELLVDFCESNPCLHGGRCVPHENGYDCICEPQYTGANCDSAVPNCGSVMYTSSYPPIRNFWSLCEINIIDHPAHVEVPCRDLIVGINHYNNSETILALGGTFGCFVTRFPDEMANGACINNYNQDQTLSACLSCTHMAVCINVPPISTPGV